MSTSVPRSILVRPEADEDLVYVPRLLIERGAEIGITLDDQAVILALLAFTHEGVARVGVRSLAAMLRCSDRSVQRFLRSLERRGFLLTYQSGGGGPNGYDLSLLWDRLAALPPRPPARAGRSLLHRAIERYGSACLRCGSSAALTADHVIPRSSGGSDRLDNIQVLCFPCNAAKGTRSDDYRG